MRPRERRVHLEVSSLNTNKLIMWAELVFMAQVQQMRGVAKVASRSSGGFDVYVDPRYEMCWVLEQLAVLARYEEGGSQWVM